METIIKVSLWRVLSIILNFVIIFLFTGDFESASKSSLVLAFILTIFHWIFESAWKRLSNSDKGNT